MTNDELCRRAPHLTSFVRSAEKVYGKIAQWEEFHQRAATYICLNPMDWRVGADRWCGLMVRQDQAVACGECRIE